MIEVGDRVRIVGGGVYMGKWLPLGTEGIVIRELVDEQTLYLTEIDGKDYCLSPAEFEVVFRAGQTVVIEDDGEI